MDFGVRVNWGPQDMNTHFCLFRLAALWGLLGALVLASPAAAEMAMSGSFTASKACAAFQSFRQGTNPGNVQLKSGQVYALIAKNKADASHYRLRIDGAEPAERWVEIDCGNVFGDTASTAPPPGARQLVLATNWQPAFCETRPQKPECVSQTAARADASAFSLHGLWQKSRENIYCNVASDVVAIDKASKWNELPAPSISAGTKQALDTIMPGTQSALDRHEWIKHGTCYGADAEAYFRESVRLMNAINGSKARELLASRIGQKVTSSELRAAFDASFGPGAGERVTMQCVRDGDRQLVIEVKIGMTGSPSSSMAVGDMIAGAKPVSAECPEGIVDPVGLQ